MIGHHPRQRIAERIREIAAAQTPPNIPLADRYANDKKFRASSQVIAGFLSHHRDDNSSRALRPPPEMLPPMF